MTTQDYEIDLNKRYILAGDISASMQSKDPACKGLSRYEYMVEKFESFIQASEGFSKEGTTVLLFGENVKTFQNVTLEKIKKDVENVTFEGFTFTDKVVKAAWQIHREQKSALAKEGKVHPGTVLLVFTDGQPSNKVALQTEIENISNNLDRNEEFCIQLVTVGTIEASLQQYLHGLDEELDNAKYDIVEIKKLEEIGDFTSAVVASQTHQRYA